VRLVVALAQEGLISESEALDRVSSQQAAAVLRPHVEPHARAGARVLATGRPACPGVVSGVIVCDTAAAEERAEAGEDIVLTRRTTDPEDVPAMTVVAAILTELGGATSHAAVISRELGVPCVVGCGASTLMSLEGTVVTIDAAAGEILQGELSFVAAASAQDNPDLAQLLVWARAEPGADPAVTLPKLLETRRA